VCRTDPLSVYCLSGLPVILSNLTKKKTTQIFLSIALEEEEGFNLGFQAKVSIPSLKIRNWIQGMIVLIHGFLPFMEFPNSPIFKYLNSPIELGFS